MHTPNTAGHAGYAHSPGSMPGSALGNTSGNTPGSTPGSTPDAYTHPGTHSAPPGSFTPAGAPPYASRSASAGVQAMADALVAAGKLSREQATQMLHAEMAEGDGAHGAHGAHEDIHAAPPSPSVRPEPVEGRAPHPNLNEQGPASSAANHNASEPDNGTDAPHPTDTPLAEIEIDPLFAPPPTPEGYTLELNPAVPATVEEVAAVRQWFHTLRLPQPIAQSLYSEVERMSQRAPTPAEIDRMTADTSAQLRRTWGERTDTMLGHARRLIDEAARTHPHLKTTLARGPGSNPLVVRQLAEHAARLYGGQAAGAPMQSNTHEGDN